MDSKSFIFTIEGKAFSINSYYYKSRNIKTKEARIWEEQILKQLEKYKIQLLELSTLFKEHGGEFDILMITYYPENIFYNKQGQISSRTFDISNIEKPLIDLIFMKTMGVDDRYLITLCSWKLLGTEYKITIQVIWNKNPRTRLKF